MEKKIIGILICMLLIAGSFLTVAKLDYSYKPETYISPDIVACGGTNKTPGFVILGKTSSPDATRGYGQFVVREIDLLGDGKKRELWSLIYINETEHSVKYHVGIAVKLGLSLAKPCKTNVTIYKWGDDGYLWLVDLDGDGEWEESWLWKKDEKTGKWILTGKGHGLDLPGDPDFVYDGDDAYFWGFFIDDRQLEGYKSLWYFNDGSAPVPADYLKYINDTFLVLPITHSFEIAGIYYVTLTVEDIYGNIISDSINIKVIAGENQIPIKPNITGQTKGTNETDYTYKFVSTDSNNDEIVYLVDWGDGYKDILGPSQSGIEVSSIHNWSSRGNYTIKAMAQDSYYDHSDWTTLEVNMSKNKAMQYPIISWLFEKLIQRFPFMLKILNQIL